MIQSLVNEYNLTHQIVPIDYDVFKFFEIFDIKTEEISMKYSFSFIQNNFKELDQEM